MVTDVRRARARPLGTSVLAAACLLATLLATLLAASKSASAQAGDPQLIVSASSAEPGTTIGVRGAGLPTDLDLQLMLCGANGTRGSIDCLAASSYILRAWDGTFELTRFLIDEPPAPCPCVIRLAATQSTFVIDVPFEVTGAPIAPIPAPVTGESSLDIVTVKVRDVAGWRPIFGGAAARVLEITVRNVGDEAIDVPSEIARWGRAGDETRAITSIDAGTLPPGHQRTLELPFELPALSVGTYSVAGVVGVGPHTAAFGDDTSAATTSTWPWGLLVGLLVVVQLVVVVVRNVLRRRLNPVTTDVR